MTVKKKARRTWSRSAEERCRTTISTRTVWRMELLSHAPLHPPQTNCRKASCTHTAREDLQRRDLFKPAQYLRTHLNQLPLLRLPANPGHMRIPSHLHLAKTTHRPLITNAITPLAFLAYCPSESCLPIKIMGDQHIFLTIFLTRRSDHWFCLFSKPDRVFPPTECFFVVLRLDTVTVFFICLRSDTAFSRFL